MSISEVFKSLGINVVDMVGVYGSIGELVRSGLLLIDVTSLDELTFDIFREIYEDLTLVLPVAYEFSTITDDELGRKRISKAALRRYAT